MSEVVVYLRSAPWGPGGTGLGAAGNRFNAASAGGAATPFASVSEARKTASARL